MTRQLSQYLPKSSQPAPVFADASDSLDLTIHMHLDSTRQQNGKDSESKKL